MTNASTFQSEKLTLSLSFDSKETLYKIEFKTNDEKLNNELVKLKTSLLDKSYEQIEPLLKESSMFVDYAFYQAYLLYKGYPGGLKEQGLDEEILCFCHKLSYSKFEEIYHKRKAVKHLVLKDSLATSFCGGCSKRVGEHFLLLEKKNQYFFDDEISVWKEKIETILRDFAFFSPAQLSTSSFELIKLHGQTIKIRCHKNDCELNRKQIHDILNDYLQSEIDRDFTLSIVT